VAAVQSVVSRWETASAAAREATRRADIELRPIESLVDVTDAAALLGGIWEQQGEPPMPTELLRALSHSGNYVVAAHQDGRIVGALVGFFGRNGDRAHLHSHILGVRDDARVGGIGFALKLHQRAWALERGVDSIIWTFDPLARGNGFFNIAKLAAVGHAYKVNFYGSMPDVINKGDDSDRLVVRWKLTDPDVDRATRGESAVPDIEALRGCGAAVALSVGPDGAPRPGTADADVVLAQVPRDAVQLRQRDPAAAAEWRLALREVMTTAFASGLCVNGMTRDGWYVLSSPRG
jgi:predicted GNAT superfamily acetyltransferase